MAANLINTETICDLQGNSLLPESITLLKALDKLLTVGAYYSSEHDQYLLAATKACSDIVREIGGAGKRATIEITAQGLMVGKQNIDPNHRNVRLLHELLVPLNIARLEISGSLTPEELRQAIAALQKHKMGLGQSSTFQEIIIKNLPATVQAISCSVLKKSEDTEENDAGSFSLDDMLDKWSDDAISANDSETESKSKQLDRQFMIMVSQILENLERHKRESGIKAQDDQDCSFVTKTDLIKLKQILQQLVEVNPDPAELTKLIAQAQRALDLSQDARSVNLAFSILKKDMAGKSAGKNTKKEPKSPRIEYKLTVDELLEAVAKLETAPVPIDEPWAGSRANQLGINLHLLRSDPPRALRVGMIETIKDTVMRPDFATNNLLLCSQAFDTIAREDGTEGLDKLLPLLSGVLRQERPEMIAPFWARLIELTDNDQMPVLWPHLVNDILFGFEGAPREMVGKLVLAAGRIPLHVAQGQDHRLQRQPALQGISAAKDLFIAPLNKMYPVYAMLLDSQLRGWMGAELFRALRVNPGSPLVKVVMAALGKHQPELVTFYLDLIRHQANPQLPPEVRQGAVEILEGALDNASPKNRQKGWVADSLAELGRLDPERARPVLKRVLNERKFLFFKAWPAPARKAAAGILSAVKKEVK